MAPRKSSQRQLWLRVWKAQEASPEDSENRGENANAAGPPGNQRLGATTRPFSHPILRSSVRGPLKVGRAGSHKNNRSKSALCRIFKPVEQNDDAPIRMQMSGAPLATLGSSNAEKQLRSTENRADIAQQCKTSIVPRFLAITEQQTEDQLGRYKKGLNIKLPKPFRIMASCEQKTKAALKRILAKASEFPVLTCKRQRLAPVVCNSTRHEMRANASMQGASSQSNPTKDAELSPSQPPSPSASLKQHNAPMQTAPSDSNQTEDANLIPSQPPSPSTPLELFATPSQQQHEKDANGEKSSLQDTVLIPGVMEGSLNDDGLGTATPISDSRYTGDERANSQKDEGSKAEEHHDEDEPPLVSGSISERTRRGSTSPRVRTPSRSHHVREPRPSLSPHEPMVSNSHGSQVPEHAEASTPALKLPTTRPTEKPSGTYPTCLNSNHIDVQPLIDWLASDGTLLLVEAFQRTMSLQRNNEGRGIEFGGDRNPFQYVRCRHESWRLSLIYDIAADIAKEIQEDGFQTTRFYVESRAKSRDDVYFDIISERRSRARFVVRPPQKYDVFLDATRDGLTLVGIYLGPTDSFHIDGHALMILDWYQNDGIEKGVYKIANFRNRFVTLRAFISLQNPTSPLMRTISTLMNDDDEQRSKLIQGRCQDIPRLTHAYGTRRKNLGAAISYVSFLLDHATLNQQQAEGIRQSLTSLSRCSVSRSQESSRLNRFFLVAGVPGCGKTHTAVQMIATLLVLFNPEFRRGQSVPYWGGQILVLTKANKALDVFMERLENVPMPRRDGREGCQYRSLPYYCRRSVSYKSRPDVDIRFHRNQREDLPALRDVPLILSTFGSLMKLYEAFLDAFLTQEEMHNWIRFSLKIIIIDEGSQCNLLDVLLFLDLFPSFDGIIVIMGDPRQLGSVILTTVKETREVLLRNLFSEFSTTSGPFFVANSEMNIQYRMHLEIMNLSNDVSYNGTMVYGRKDNHFHQLGSSLTSSNMKPHGRLPWSPILGPVVAYSTSFAGNHLFACKEGEFTNIDEICLAENIIASAVSRTQLRFEDFVFLSPYKNQCLLMRNRCVTLRWKVKVHTVAAFQGEEAPVIIYSLVRRRGSGAGFFHIPELVNVAITRPKQSLIIIGDLSFLQDRSGSSSVWSNVLISFTRRYNPVLEAQNYI